ncbi:MAG TPA: phosphatase PAP2 family protein [Patescibacteria group bacterium]|nr:phosphatase PAP2 family protein [Patescibacteria group bacterium]
MPNAKVTTKKAATPKRKPAPEPALEPEPEVAPAIKHQGWYTTLLAVGLVILGVSAAFAASRTMPGWEQRIFYDINNVHAPSWVGSQVAKQLSNAVWGLVGLVFLALFVPRARVRYRAWQYAAAVGLGFVAEFVFEHIINRARPELLIPHVVLRAQQGGPGFPSGHETALAALVFTMWFFVAWPWRILLVALLVAEAWARIFLGVHAPLDVVGGLGVGMAAVGGIHLLPAKIRKIFRLS